VDVVVYLDLDASHYRCEPSGWRFVPWT